MGIGRARRPSHHPPCRRGARIVLAALVLAALVLTTLPAAAQINTEALRIRGEKAGFGGFFDLSFALNRGNQHLEEVGTDFRLEWIRSGREAPGERKEAGEGSVPAAPPRDRVFLVGKVDFGRSQGLTFRDSGFGHLRWTHSVARHLAWEAFVQDEYDRFLLLDRRTLLGSGVRLELVRRKGFESFLGSGLMVEQDVLDLPPGVPDRRETTVVRSTSYLTTRLARGDDGLRLVYTLYVQPRVDDPGDIRVLDEAELEVALAAHLSLAVSFHTRYDSRPPTGVKSLDVSLENKLRLRF